MDGLLRDDVVRSTASSPGIKDSLCNAHCLRTFCETVLFEVAPSKNLLAYFLNYLLTYLLHAAESFFRS